MTTNCVIFDMDGTLADVRHRLHHIRKSPPDWQAFFDGCVNDPGHQYVKELYWMVNESENAPPIFICSGRPDSHRQETEQWLESHFIQDYHALLMRKDGDRRPDVVVKREMLEAIRGQGFEPMFAVDDRPSVVEMWRAEGVPCFQVDDAEWREPQAFYTDDIEGKTLLTLMIGPSHAGKSSWLDGIAPFHILDSDGDVVEPDEIGIHWSHVVSSDQVREDLGITEHDHANNQRTFAAVHDVVRARLAHGLPTVIDATHLRRRDRRDAVDLAPAGTRVRYIVFNRSLEDKLTMRRPGFPEDVIRKQDHDFRSQVKDILAGDGLANVDVVDLRVYKG